MFKLKMKTAQIRTLDEMFRDRYCEFEFNSSSFEKMRRKLMKHRFRELMDEHHTCARPTHKGARRSRIEPLLNPDH